MEKPFNNGAGSTVWFETCPTLQCEIPPSYIKAQDGEFYKSVEGAMVKLWMMENGQWRVPVEGIMHPTIHGRRLRILMSGVPSWITSASYAVEKHRKLQKDKGRNLKTPVVVCSLS